MSAANKLVKFLEFLKKNKDLILRTMWMKVGKHAIKHAPDGVSRGKIVTTFQRMKLDLSKWVANTERLPGLKKRIEPNEIAVGRRQYDLPQGNRLRFSGQVQNFARMLADILNDPESPFEALLAGELKKLGVQRGAV